MKTISRAGLIAALANASMGVCGLAAPALAQQDTISQQMTDIRNAVGLGSPRAPIDFSERPPLVVPPSNVLPPPAADDPPLAVNDPDVIARRKALTDSRRSVPPSDPGATAQGLDRRTYLVEPPSGLRNPRAVAADITLDKSTSTAAGPKRVRHHNVKRTPAPEAAAQ